MKIENLKELQALVKLCKRQGIPYMKIDNMEFQISPESQKQQQFVTRDFLPEETIKVPKPNLLPSQTQLEIPDELSEEQLLYYSSRPEAPGEQ
jgi:hypothetical protein